MEWIKKIIKWRKSFKSLDAVLWFGKNKDETIRAVIDLDPQYIQWCLNENIFKLGLSAKIYYKRKLKQSNEEQLTFLKAVYEFEQEHGVWMDDGKGNSGFVKDGSFY